MIYKKLIFGLFLSFAFLLSACGDAAQQAPGKLENPAPTAIASDNGLNEPVGAMSAGEAMTEKTPVGDGQEEMAEDATPENTTPPVGMKESEGASMNAPAFFSASLVDVNSGQAFAIKDFLGKVVLVETMAMWCPKCLSQQKQVLALHELLGAREDFVSLGLDVDPNENRDDLKGYVVRNGFVWKYAVAPAAMAREIGQLFGDQFLNPSTTPMFIIDRQGNVHPLPFGIKSAQDLHKALEPFLQGGM